MNTFELTGLDLTVMAVYAVFIIGYGLYSAKAQTSEEYFLAGRNMTWPIVGISLFAANISSSTLVGLAGDAAKTNTQVFNYEWLASVVLVFFAIFFLPFYLRSKVYTMPEFLERRYDVRSRYYFSFITIVGNVLIDTASGLYVGTVVLKLLFPDLNTFTIVSILAIAAAAYTVPGGLNSVIQTEVIQAILLVIGSCLITYYAFDEVGGWSEMIAKLDILGAAGELPNINEINAEASGVLEGVATTTIPLADRVYESTYYTPQNAEEVLSLVRPADDRFMPWPGLLFGAPILGFYFWATNQFMVQRVLGAKDLNHGRWGALFAGLLKLPVLFIMVLPGTLAIILFKDFDIATLAYKLPDGGVCQNLVDCPNATYPLLLFTLLPKGVLGLVLAGLLAAMMSSVSATFNSASTLITMDFAIKMKPDLTSKQLVRIGQISTLVLVVLACLWAPQIEKAASLWEYLQIVLSFIAPPVAAAFIVGMFYKRANGHGAFYSLIIGALVSIVYVIMSVMVARGTMESNAFLEMHFLYRTSFLFLACAIINVVVSLATPPPPAEKVANYTWNNGIIAAESRELEGVVWYKNYRYQALILLILTFILVGYFW
ncbi:SSS family solute:Na+ symporter [Lewinella aquimaris]|uniref:SSS family solute:Na+ symporter n=1 Tax=Neolewinella aquimaris TaxID=1835722 RepID=A0A840E7E8_9BACT|nr:sodium:solute symporter [Neolewinella aquimaris]MBB4077729.1 SSS family solute:Na+ symporter [Neolewinella aquimaris]